MKTLHLNASISRHNAIVNGSPRTQTTLPWALRAAASQHKGECSTSDQSLTCTRASRREALSGALALVACGGAQQAQAVDIANDKYETLPSGLKILDVK